MRRGAMTSSRTLHYCTFFDRNFLARAVALLASMEEHSPPFHLWMLCMDDASYEALRRMKPDHATVLPAGDVEARDARLGAARESRSRAEYYFTIKPFFISRVLGAVPDGALLTYLDSDLFFFSRLDPDDPPFRECSIVLSPHRYPPAERHRERYGLYNAGLVAVRRDARGEAFLEWWRERCIEWCRDRVEDDRYADQKYLDRVPGRFGGVGFFSQNGINLAPWNVRSHPVLERGGRLTADGDPLVLFHFHGLRALGGGRYDSNARNFRFRMSPVLRERVYKPYVVSLLRAEARIASHGFPILAAERRGVAGTARLPGVPDRFLEVLRRLADLYYRGTFRVPAGEGESVAGR
jgi:hypothetical protein